MAIHLRHKSSLRRDMLLGIGGLFLLFALCFSLFQRKREREFRIDLLHYRLQVYNHELIRAWNDSLAKPEAFRNYLCNDGLPNSRTTIISRNGTVLFDSEQADVSKLDNHLSRAEVLGAIERGSGFEVKRVSESTHTKYLYSATLFPAKGHTGGDIIIRTALPYDADIANSLKTDSTYIYVALLLVLLFGAVLYYYTYRIGRHVRYLRDFAREAEHSGALEPVSHENLPHDELGEISHTITELYWKLRNAEETNIRLKRQLTENVAHELKTPAASINGYLECIMTDKNMPEDTRNQFIERCYAQSERMVNLLRDISTLTKLDRCDDGSTVLQCSEVDLIQLLGGVLEDVRLQLEESGMKVISQTPESAEIKGDSTLLYGVFRNIIDNALCYATGATLLRISCMKRFLEGRDCYLFRISDNGAGVADEHLEHIFERFYRVDKGRSRKMGGTGLGLSIVKNAVQAHNGTIHAEHTPGGGLTIEFTLSEPAHLP